MANQPAKRPAAKKPAATKTTAAKPAAKKTTAAKPAAKKPAAAKPAAKKTTAAKTTAAKTTAQKPAAPKTAAPKTTAAKTAAQKTAAQKTAAAAPRPQSTEVPPPVRASSVSSASTAPAAASASAPAAAAAAVVPAAAASVSAAPAASAPSAAPAPVPSTAAALVAEAFGTLLLVLGVISTALFAAGFGAGTDAANLGVGFLGVSLVVGLTVVAGAYAFGPISGGHFNPAVTLGLAAAGRFGWGKVVPYIIAQLIGGLVATTLIVLIGMSGPGNWLTEKQQAGFASNGFGEGSPGGFGIGAAMIGEVLFTALFVIVILGVTHPVRGTKFAGLAIGLTLTLIHLALIPIDNASVNPARSLATAVYGGALPLGQLWVFIVFPIIGALIAGFAYRALFDGVRRA